MIRLLLVRHGATTWNIEHRFQGMADVPLSDLGRRQVAALADRLAGEEIHAVYASDLKRAWDTATVIAALHDLQAHADIRLRELGFGAWEGLTFDEIRARDPEGLAAWKADPMHVETPGGDNMAKVMGRVQALLEEISCVYQGQTVLLVSHAGPLQMVLYHALGMLPEGRWEFRLSAGSLSKLKLYEDGAVLTLLNGTYHLREAQDG